MVDNAQIVDKGMNPHIDTNINRMDFFVDGR